MSENALAKVDRESGYVVGIDDAISPERLLKQVTLIQNVMKSVMVDGEHYGIIPGTGKRCPDCNGKKDECPKCKGTGIVGKPSLLKPGAEKLCFTFRMDPEFDVEILPISHKVQGHREYRIKCTLFAINGGQRLGSGVGSASTMESKWRFRTGPKELTDRPVPKTYWDNRDSDPKKAQEAIGGKGFSVGKGDDKLWYIAISGEKVENENPADIYNTVLKVGKKRALVDAVLTCTAASDCFTQDIEDLVDNGVIPGDAKDVTPKSAPASPPGAAPPEAGGTQPPSASPPAAGEKSEAELRADLEAVCGVIAKIEGLTAGDVLHYLTVNKDGKYGVKDFSAVRMTAKGPKGDWSPLKATLHKANERYKAISEEPPQTFGGDPGLFGG